MIKPFLLKTAFVLLTFSSAVGSQSGSKAQDELQTPQRTVTTTAVEPTPEQRLCQRQAQTLTRDHFVSVLDPQIVDGWGINWKVSLNSSLPFDDAQKRHIIRLVANKMKTIPATKVDGAPRSLYLEILGLQGDAEGIHAERLDILALTYFSKVFPHAELTPEMKLDGVQLGERIVVQRANQLPLTYHVKTHSAGRLSSNSTAPKLVNPQELMAYRILQYLGVGCEAHFFERSPEDVYIATLDAGTGGTFTLFEVMSGHLGRGGDGGVGLRLAGNLINIAQDPSKLDHANIESVVNYDPVAKNFIRQMVTLDIITRVCKLHDLLNNPGNFGFFTSDGQPPSIRVIDFRIMDTKIFQMDNGDFGGFLVGNGLYQYAGSHRTMRYILNDRPRQARVEEARSVMAEDFIRKLRRSIELSHQDVLTYVRRDVFVPQHAELMPKIQEYHHALLHNIDFFAAKLQEWTPEADAAREAEYAKYGMGPL